MLHIDNNKIEFTCQGFKSVNIETIDKDNQSIMYFESTRETKDFCCPICGSKVYTHGIVHTKVVDIPFYAGNRFQLDFKVQRFQCQKCNKTFTEDIPFIYPTTRITYRAAQWIKGFVKWRIPISSIQAITTIHWDTIHKIQQEFMQEMIDYREKEKKETNYKPKYLAIDEFAIHKGHRYATCVMDLDTGEIIWVGMGRSMSCFAKFFEDIPAETLTDVVAVAMDMNASYNTLVTEHLPKAQIVYDRFHMQSQFGKEVLGVVRLEEAKKHKEFSKDILASSKKIIDQTQKQKMKQEAKKEKSKYNELKRARWSLLLSNDKLSENKKNSLNEILENHQDLAVCYALKEEMLDIYKLTDRTEAEKRWQKWFNAAKESNIPALVKFASQKEKRIDGLISHAEYPISTGKLEGFNNKIKVAKRISYGYRNDAFFFVLIRYLSLDTTRHSKDIFHRNP